MLPSSKRTRPASRAKSSRRHSLRIVSLNGVLVRPKLCCMLNNKYSWTKRTTGRTILFLSFDRRQRPFLAKEIESATLVLQNSVQRTKHRSLKGPARSIIFTGLIL